MLKKPLFMLLGALLLLVVASWLFGKKAISAVTAAVWDKISEGRINNLHPLIREKARAFLNEAERQGIKLRVVSGFRSWEEQQELYDQGRGAPGEIVTNAKPGSSFHNFGLAFDVVPIVDGAADWNSKLWPKIGALGKKFGFKWGGNFTSLVDKPHFEYSTGKTLAQLRSLYETDKTDPDGYVLIA